MLTRETHVATEPDASGPASTVEEVAGQVLQTAADVLTKPRARGWIHLVSAVVAVAAGASLIAVSWPLAGLKPVWQRSPISAPWWRCSPSARLITG